MPDNLLAPDALPDTLLPADPAVAALASGSSVRDAVMQFPDSCAAWAALVEQTGEPAAAVERYAFARVGYHRGLDALRRNGWRGQGPIPWEHAPNQGFLRCLAALSAAAAEIGETAEAQRCATFLRDSSPAAAVALGVPAAD